MKKILILFLGLLLGVNFTTAQNGDYLYVMRLGNSVCKLQKSEIDTMVVHHTQDQPDSLYFLKNDVIIYRRATAQIDSIVFYNPFLNGINVETIPVTGGTFTMGTPANEVGFYFYEVQHEVLLSDYSIGKYEVTNTQFAAFLNAKNIDWSGKDPLGNYPTRALANDWRADTYPWAPPAPIDSQSTAPMKAPAQDFYPWGMRYENNQWQSEPGYENYPAIFVTWYGAAEFAEFVGGRLPSEAQWEFACRAGTTTPFSTGYCISDLQANFSWRTRYAGCDSISNVAPNHTMPVDSYQPNPWGFYNMHGNVYEWCSDWFSNIIPTGLQIDPEGPTTSTYTKTYKGGYFQSQAIGIRSGFRNGNGPTAANAAIGFRIAKMPEL